MTRIFQKAIVVLYVIYRQIFNFRKTYDLLLNSIFLNRVDWSLFDSIWELFWQTTGEGFFYRVDRWVFDSSSGEFYDGENHCRQRAPVGIVLSSSGTSQLGMFDIQATTKCKYYDHIVLLYLESRRCRYRSIIFACFTYILL